MEQNLTHEYGKMEDFYVKKQLEIEATYAKGQVQNQVRLELEDQKALRQEWRREMLKAKYSQVTIREDGELEVETKSEIISVPKRKASNFKFLDLLRLMSVDGDGPVFVLLLKIGEREVSVYLDGAKVGRGEYLLRKINEVGGRVLIETKHKKADFMTDFWIAARACDCGYLLIPVSPGWISIGEKQYRFVKEEETLWNEIIKRAK